MSPFGGDHQGRPSTVIARIDFGAGIDQQSHRLDAVSGRHVVAVTGRPHQHRERVAVALIDVDAGVKKQPDDRRGTLSRGVDDGALLRVVDNVDFGALVQHQPHDVLVAVVGHRRQHRYVLRVMQVHVGARGDQKLHGLAATRYRGAQQGGAADQVPLIDLGTGLKQDLHRIETRRSGGEHEGGVAEPVSRDDRCPLFQEADDLFGAAFLRGFEQRDIKRPPVQKHPTDLRLRGGRGQKQECRRQEAQPAHAISTLAAEIHLIFVVAFSLAPRGAPNRVIKPRVIIDDFPT